MSERNRDIAELDELSSCIDERALRRPRAGDDVDDDEEALAWWLARMARITRDALAQPREPIDPTLVARLAELLADRPAERVEHAQLHVDVESCLRRALAIRECSVESEPVLAVGDDDGVTIALALLGARSLHAVDIDPRVLAFVEERALAAGARVETHLVDLFEQPVPSALRRRMRVVVTDPPRSIAEAAPFLAFSAAALRRDTPAWLFACDHPDWSFEDAVPTLLRELGLELVETRENLHAYPLDARAFPKLDAAAAALAIDGARARSLLERTRAWSHLHVARRPPG